MKSSQNSKKIIEFPSSAEHNSRNKSIYPLLLVIIILVILFLLFSWFRSFLFSWFTTVEMVTKEDIEKEIESEITAIVRDEKVIRLPANHDYTQHIKEGERVNRRQEIFTWIPRSYAGRNAYKEDHNKEERIRELMGNISSGWQDIEGHVNKTLTVYEQKDNEKKESESQANRTIVGDKESDIVKHGITAPEPGLISFYVDGLEDKLTAERELSPKELKALYEDYQGPKSINPSEPGGHMSPGFRLVDNYSWQAFVVIPKKYGDDLSQGDRLEVEFGFAPNVTITGEVIRLDKFNQGYVSLLEFNREVQEFWKHRFANASIYLTGGTGYKLHNRALEEVDGDVGVYTVEQGVAKFKPVEILGEADCEHVFVQGLEEGELVIQNSFFVGEGDILQ